MINRNGEIHVTLDKNGELKYMHIDGDIQYLSDLPEQMRAAILTIITNKLNT